MKIIRTTVWFVMLIALAGAAQAQTNLLGTSDALRQNINELESIDVSAVSPSVRDTHKSSVRQLYQKYLIALDRDIDALKRIQAAMQADSDLELQPKIEKLTEERKAVTEKLTALGVQRSPAAVLEKHLPRSCQEFYKGNEEKLPVGMIWCGRSAKPLVEDLAVLSAPILWFSPDEPLRLSGRKIPENLPGHNVEGPIVYYRISQLTLNPATGKNEYQFNDNSEDVDLTRVDGLTLRYYFYYSQDIGFNRHAHDLESIRLDVRFSRRDPSGEKLARQTSDGIYVAQIEKVIGAAHGVTWYYNQLDVPEGTSLPITILVEEGKHASSPDRNADGHYSPGYDVNKRLNDAWGVRDLIGSGELGNVGYEGSMTKPRDPKDMLRVKPSDRLDRETILSPYTGPYKSKVLSSETYELKRITRDTTLLIEDYKLTDAIVVAQQVQQQVSQSREEVEEKAAEDVKGIQNYMQRENFDEDKPRQTHADFLVQKAMKKGLGIERGEETLDALTIAYRYDNGHGFSMLPPFGRYRSRVFSGYFAPKFNFVSAEKGNRFSVEALYTPSAARRVDWYAALGPEWSRREDTGEYKPRLASEGGIKFRFNLTKFLMGARIGLRASGLKQPQSPRLIIELGPGAF
jgi:hypothetical protein